MSTLTLKINDQFKTLITDAARAAQVSKSEWVRRAVLAYSKQPAKKAEFVSALDLAGNLAGCFQGGPGDLSTNPRHMDDFGRV